MPWLKYNLAIVEAKKINPLLVVPNNTHLVSFRCFPDITNLIFQLKHPENLSQISTIVQQNDYFETECPTYSLQQNPPTAMCNGEFHREVCNFAMRDLGRMIKSGCFWGSKFNVAVGPVALLCHVRRLRGYQLHWREYVVWAMKAGNILNFNLYINS